MIKIIKKKNYEEMSAYAAEMIAAQILLKPCCVLGLATGSTPLGTYSKLIEKYQAGLLDFAKVRSVNLDEYCGLSPEHDQSYHYYMKENLFSHINIDPDNTHVPNGMAQDMKAEGERYDALIASLGGIDLQLLGIGNTGHIGFNEPDSNFPTATHRVRLAQKTIEANSRFFASVDDVPKYAVTMGMTSIMSARKILLLANGVSKAEIIKKSFFDSVTPQVPASILQLHPDVTVVVDEEAGSLLP